jgi:F420H(2)-dependent quinone reductase
MSDQPNLKYRIVSTVQKHILNRVARHLPITTLETIGRKSGVPRRTPVGGRVIDNAFWMVSEHGNRAQYVKNIPAGGALVPRTCCPTTIRSSGSNSCPAATAQWSA